MKIVGYKVTTFNTQDGKHISGVTFYVTEKTNRDSCFGLMTDKFFVSDNKLAGQKFDIGNDVTPVYNRYGKIESVLFR